ncbi:four helix bundle protein [Lewinella sp. IMCC34183]|uniref:four helix bundle protein n=1 Tax=Lewinella sp. IMCC34183 TaxID=2248762 RepID=UPI000E27352B|nr:four helix bundle protein [Lewinella sp. IMCC34183]
MQRSYFTSWLAYQKAHTLASSICRLTASFPVHERYALSDQIRRSSRSVCANLAESYAKRRYPKHFLAKLTDAAAENYESQVWLSFAREHGYLNDEYYASYQRACEEVGKLLSYMMNHPDQYLPGIAHTKATRS